MRQLSLLIERLITSQFSNVFPTLKVLSFRALGTPEVLLPPVPFLSITVQLLSGPLVVPQVHSHFPIFVFRSLGQAMAFLECATCQYFPDFGVGKKSGEPVKTEIPWAVFQLQTFAIGNLKF